MAIPPYFEFWVELSLEGSLDPLLGRPTCQIKSELMQFIINRYSLFMYP